MKEPDCLSMRDKLLITDNRTMMNQGHDGQTDDDGLPKQARQTAHVTREEEEELTGLEERQT